MLALQRPAPMEDFQLGCNLTVVGAKSLIAADSNGKSDPYVVAHFGQMQKKSGVMKKTLNPTWNLSVPIPVWLPEDILYLKVWDADLLDDDFLGGSQLIISISLNSKRSLFFFFVFFLFHFVSFSSSL